jgi:GNAT superfamily N-acetyltransferase
MAYSIRLPDGTLVRNIPDELSPEEAKARIIKAYPQYAPESGDVFVPALKSGFSGVQEAGYALAGRTGLMDEAAAQKAIEEEQAYQQRVFKPTEEGFLEAPVTKTLELLGQSLPFMALPVAAAGATLALPFTGAAATVAGLGAAGLASGAQFTGTNLLRQMEPTDDAPQGKSIGETDLGNAALAAVPQAALDVLSLRMMPFIRGVFGQVGKDLSEEAARRIASKNLKDVAADYALATGKTMTVEGLTEAAQQSLERLQAGLTMTDEAARDEYLESFIGGAVLGGVLAPPGRYLERRAAQKEVPPETKPEPTATQPTAPTPITDEDELTPEEEADLQARIAATPPAAGLPVAATPTQPLAPPAAVQQVTASPEAVALPGTQQLTPQAAPELEVLTAQLARIQQARMDPTLSPDDPAFLEFDQQEAAIQARIQQLTAPAQIAQTPPSAPQAPKGAADNFLDAVVTQFSMDRGEAQKALDTLVQEELIELDPNSGQFRMKDGRFWDPDVMRKAAAMQTAAPPLQLPQPLAPPVAPVVEPEVIPEEAMVTPEIQVPFDETLTPPGPSLEDQVREQKAEERRERQAAQEAKKGEFVLQNRDRSSTGSIQQMQNIANAPDYSRAGFSRTPDGAPIIAFGDYAPERLGREDVVTTARGRKIPVQYAVVEADEVITSNDIQGRADNRYGDKSVPGPRAIAGNGRVTGLRESFERGTATPYVEEMAADSTLHGISPDVIAGMKKPVLVRVMPQEGLTRDIGDELNISSMLELSPVEQAKNDLNRVDFEGLQFNEEGEITNESLSQFIAAQPVEERTKLIDRGLPTKQARQRLENAIFARAYADDDLIAMFAQTEDVEARLVINALAQVAPQMAQLEGAGDLDIRDIVTDAAKIIVSGKRRGLKLKEISAQVDMTVDPDTKIIVDMFAQNPRSNKAAIESLRNAAELAYNESIRPEEGLFGVEPRRERRDIMEQMRRGYEPTRTEDVAEAQRPGPAPSDVERKAEPSAATVPPADQGFQLTGQTPEELAELQRKELSGEAEAERDRIEAEEAAKAAEIAAKKIAEQKGEQPGDLAPTTGKMELSAPPITDLFGTQGITDQPVRGPRRVAAEPSPIEKLAAKEPTVDEAIEEELKKAGYDDLGKMSKNIQDEFGVGKPVADAYARAVQNARIQVVRSQFGLVTESQLREALNEQTKLRNRIDGIVKRKEPKKEPEAEKKPSIRKTREVAEGTVVERIELPDNIEIRIVKLKNGYSVYQYDLDSDQKKFETIVASKNDQDAYRAAEAFASDMFDKVVPKMADEMQAAMKERLSRGEDVVNNKTPDPGIPADQRLVLMACCATKKKGMGMGPAIEVYTGVFFQTLKNKLKEGAMPNLRILSAKYGFIAPDQKIEVYDQVMDKSSADGFMLDDKLVEGFPSNIKDVLIVGSDQYQRVMKAAIEDLIKAGKIDKGASINVTKGGIGEQRSQLGRYLQSIPAKREPEAKKAAKTPLAFYQQMIPDAGFKRLDLDDPRTYKNKSGEEFLTFERDGVRVAVKSNTQLYAADRGVGMYMGKDNDLLIQAMIVDESARRQGKATKALQDILSMADQAGMTSYIEPVQMAKDVGMTTEQLKDFYKRFGFKPQKTEPATDRVMIREPGAKIEAAKKEEKPKAEEFVRGTEEQLKEIKEFAKRYGGSEVAYYDPDKDIGMVLAFGKFDGDPKYIPYIKGIVGRTAFDISVAKFPEVLPYKAELLEIKERLEKAAEKKHQENPFIKFERGIALSDGMDPKIEGIIREWKDMLGLGGINIYFSTTEDAKKNINNFTGPHRRIGSATIDANERGSMRRMEGGASYYVVFDKSTSTTKMLEVIAHEMGHVHEKVAFDQAPQEVKDKLKAAYEKWLEGRKDKTSREAIQMLRAKTTAQTTDIGQTIETAEQLDKLDPYWSKFSEWYADQVSRWAVTDEKPVGAVEKFFARLGAALRRFYQTLKGQKYLPDETFVQYLKQVKPTIVETIPGPIKDQVNQDMSSKMLKDLFGSEKEAVDIKRIMEVYPPKKKLPPKRSPELAAAAAALNAGELTAAEYDALVNIYRPIPYYFEPLKPATEEQVIGALDVSKKPKANPPIQNGQRVGLRLDIPAFDRHGVFVVSIHQKRTASAPGKVIGYASVAKAKNITFGIGNELKALDIAMGQGKDALQTMEGEYVNITPEQAFAEAQRTIKDPNYVQVGFDPTRHSYFFDRRTTLPVVSAEEVLQIGNMILAKKPVFGRKQDFLYNIDSAPVQSAAELDAKRDRENQEKLRDLQDLRPTKIALPEKVRSYASSEEGQRVIAALNMTGEELERTVQKQYEGYTADNFMRRARKGLDEGEISADVFAVVQSMYMADPKLLDGLRLDVKQKFTPEELAQRRAEGKPSPMGAFAPFERVVYLYTGTKGVTDPMTIRHELTHTLEQLMTPAQRKAVVNTYIAALKKAAKKHKDAKSREFFDNVVKYLNEPSNDSRDAMNKSLPSLDFYQFTSPSEYWAVNAEKLMAQRLGVPWDRFKKAVRKMFEKMKNIFGFDNRFVVHDVFDKIMSGSKERMDTEMLANFVASSKQEYEMIEKTKEDAELVRRYNRTPTSQTDSAPLRRIMIGAAENSKDLFKSMVESPSEAINFMFNSVNRGVMFLRNKFIWFGSGINETDRIRYNGAVKTAEGLATASVALDNMIRGGNIATQVIMQGGVEFNKKTQMYGAAQKDKSMANVYRAEAKLKEKLGDQLGTDIEQGYLQAKRSRSIIDEVETRTQIVESLNEQIDEMVATSKALDADPKATQKQKDDVNRELRRLFKEYRVAADELKTIKRIREDKVTMSEQEIADFIQREEAHPELKEILDNFNAVNQNLLRFWRDVGLLSESRYERLSSIKDYVPWYRVMDDDADIHDPVQATTRSATNIGKEKLFKAGKPSVVTDFTVEENQKVFKVQPGAVNAVKLNGIRLKPDQYDVQPNGEITLKVEAKPGQLLVVETQREIENMIDNMTRNVMRMTMNGLRKYAANRIVSEYATREAGKIKRFATADRNKGRFDYIENGRRTIVEIQDPLIAEAVLGMETVGMKMWEPLAAAANFTRRTITLSPVFQLKQVFKDAPTAALVTGVRNPAALMGGVMRDFIGAVRGDDPVAEILRSQGIGGFYSPARTPEADVKRQIGIINNNTYDYVMKALDHFGDSSDMAQRIAIYKRVMAETGDETLALYQAANVINFLRHGSGQVAQALVKTVPFLNAYAQSIDVLYDALRGGGLRGKDRAAALRQLAITGSLLAGTTLIYAMLVGDDDDYMKMDDQSKIRSYMIPGTDVVLPMNTSAAFFFKAIPELLYNKAVNEGTETEVDAKRLRTAMKEAAVDLLLGPTPVPSAVKPIIEIGLDYNFFTSRPVTPRGMQSLDAYQQYDMRTSEAAKILSSLTGTDEKRVLNPMEADHLVRSIFGTAGAMVAWSSNLVGQAAEFRPEMGLKEMPVTGAFLRPEVPRGREDLFYKLKDDTDRKYRTYLKLTERDNQAEAQAYINRHPNLVAYYEYTSEMDAQLKEINSAIRFIGETRDPSYTPELKRREIQEFLNLKQDILEGVEQFRKEAYAN